MQSCMSHLPYLPRCTKYGKQIALLFFFSVDSGLCTIHYHRHVIYQLHTCTCPSIGIPIILTLYRRPLICSITVFSTMNSDVGIPKIGAVAQEQSRRPVVFRWRSTGSIAQTSRRRWRRVVVACLKIWRHAQEEQDSKRRHVWKDKKGKIVSF